MKTMTCDNCGLVEVINRSYILADVKTVTSTWHTVYGQEKVDTDLCTACRDKLALSLATIANKYKKEPEVKTKPLNIFENLLVKILG